MDKARNLALEVLEVIAHEAEITFARSSGAGGQNVNKVESKVQLRWNISASSLSAELKEKVRRGLPSYITLKNDLLMTSERFRDQGKNKKDVLDKLEDRLIKAFAPVKKRKPTRVSATAKLKRRIVKKRRSEIKQGRKKVSKDD